MSNIWNTDTAYEIAKRTPQFAVIPVGSLEQHGQHLPITTDTLIAGLIAKSVCDQFNGFLVSPVTVTCSHEHAGFPFSVSISAATLIAVIEDQVASIEAQGIPLTVIVNGHGGNYVIGNIAQELNVSRPRVFLCPGRQHWQEAMDFAGVESSISADMHGGEIETSILMHAMPDVVRESKIEDCESTDRPLLSLYGMTHYTDSGIIGFPSRATPEKGQKILQKMTELIGRDIRHILSN